MSSDSTVETASQGSTKNRLSNILTNFENDDEIASINVNEIDPLLTVSYNQKRKYHSVDASKYKKVDLTDLAAPFGVKDVLLQPCDSDNQKKNDVYYDDYICGDIAE